MNFDRLARPLERGREVSVLPGGSMIYVNPLAKFRCGRERESCLKIATIVTGGRRRGGGCAAALDSHIGGEGKGRREGRREEDKWDD